IVAFILEAGESAELRIDGCGSVATFREDANRLIGRVAVVGVEIKKERRVQGVALGVQTIARIFDEDDSVGIPEATIVETTVGEVTAVDKGKSAAIAENAKTEDGAQSAKRGGFGECVGVAGRVKNEFGEV